MPELRVFRFQGKVERSFQDLRHVPFDALDPEDLGEPLELLLEGRPGCEADVVGAGLGWLEAGGSQADRSR